MSGKIRQCIQESIIMGLPPCLWDAKSRVNFRLSNPELARLFLPILLTINSHTESQLFNYLRKNWKSPIIANRRKLDEG